ncbi:423_t:CDS:2 [Cetraspora pellucida]|uniref:423_t:CDS:1 n=2 Tax=Gigasporaceae TaxID=36753 RepID=A0A9N9GIH0_9GLOM|nr:423_t:CDS:2 [Cetraspora pellucida]
MTKPAVKFGDSDGSGSFIFRKSPDSGTENLVDIDMANKNVSTFEHDNKVPFNSVNPQGYTEEKVDNYTAVARIVAEEREQKNRLPNYPGLERYRLLEKMGDGAFSNVYKAINVVTQEKVAIKVVRKRELNSAQERHLHRDMKVRPRATEVLNRSWDVIYINDFKDKCNAVGPQGALRVDVHKIAFFINCVSCQENETSILNPLTPIAFANQRNCLRRSNILKEVRIMRQLKHKSIVALKSFSESDDYYYLVLELMEGGELFHQIVRLTYFSEELARHVIVQVAEGIRYLHEEVGVVHRDIKPENLLFEPIPYRPSKEPKPSLFDEPKEDEGEFIPGIGGGGIGKIKIADFGLSKVVWNEQTMTPCGTVGYTAPEIVKDERYSKSVDMWALGCVLYTLLCGFPPFYDESIRDLTEKVAKGQYTFLSPWWDNISDSSKDLISHLLSVDPEKRYTINQFFEHPWVKNEPFYLQSAKSRHKEPLKIKTSVDSSTVPTIYNDLNTPGEMPRRKDVISPSITLKEAFDVSCAVHRMEEEGAKRRKIKMGGGQKAGALNPFKNLTANLNDDVSDDETSTSTLEQVIHTTAKEPIKMKTGTRKGGVIPSTSAKHSKEGSKRLNFELNIDRATLLGRRRKIIAEPVGV